jgi:hypothetical protein
MSRDRRELCRETRHSSAHSKGPGQRAFSISSTVRNSACSAKRLPKSCHADLPMSRKWWRGSADATSSGGRGDAPPGRRRRRRPVQPASPPGRRRPRAPRPPARTSPPSRPAWWPCPTPPPPAPGSPATRSRPMTTTGGPAPACRGRDPARQVRGHQRGDLCQREHEDEVEEQLDRRDPSLLGDRAQAGVASDAHGRIIDPQPSPGRVRPPR